MHVNHVKKNEFEGKAQLNRLASKSYLAIVAFGHLMAKDTIDSEAL